VIVVFAEDVPRSRTPMMDFIKTGLSEITSLLYIVNRKLNDTIYDQEVITWSGRDHLVEQMEASGGAVQFKIGPKSFFQTNSAQAQRLYQVVSGLAAFRSEERRVGKGGRV